MKRPSNTLPVQLTSFIGRKGETAEVKRLLATTRLLTLTGPGGCGKTRLAIEVAADLGETFPDGVWWVELVGLDDPALVSQAVAAACGIREQPRRSLTETLTDYLRSRDLLLVLDNCEHLVEACARLAETLLRACPNLRILATSRESLNIASETAWRVPSLAVPDPKHLAAVEAPTDLVSSLTQYAAVRLFVERATTVQRGFTLTNQTAVAVAQVCYRLDGIPLAIELAAARVKVLTVAQIAARLDDCFTLLTAGSRTALPRHQTLRATIGWSYDLLSEQERSLFCRLTVFAGGWTLEAAEAVCARAGIEQNEVLELLSHLVDKSLVVMQEQRGEARYRLLETMRQYGWEKLRAAEVAEVIPRHHAAFYLALAEQVEPKLMSAERDMWLERLELEHDNLRAALRWATETEEGETGLRLAGALYWFWFVRGYLSEGRHWLEGSLALSLDSGRMPAQAKAHYGAGVLAYLQGDYAKARAQLEASVAIYQELGDRRGVAYSLSWLGLVPLYQGDHALARSFEAESVALFRHAPALEDKWGLAFALFCLGQAVTELGDFAAALALYEESLARFQEVGDAWGISLSLSNLGSVLYRQGDYATACARLEASVALLRKTGDKWTLAHALNSLGEVTCAQGDYRRAVTLCEESLLLCRELGNQEGAAWSLRNLGHVVQSQGNDGQALALFAEGLAVFWEQGNKLGIAACLAGLAGVVGSTISTNTAHSSGGGIQNNGTLTLTNSTIRDNIARLHVGGAIHNSGPLTLTNSTVSGNQAGGGAGAIFDISFDTLTMTNVTISGNATGGVAGGIFSDRGPVNLNNVTITQNTAGNGGGIVQTDLSNAASAVKFKNTIVAGNSAASAPDCSGTLTSEGFNLVQNTTGCAIIGTLTGNLIGQDPTLGPLQNNGGPTATHALLASSPAIDTGNPAAPGSAGSACAARDQRGTIRPQDGNHDGTARCDIGAFEVVSVGISKLTPVSGTSQVGVQSTYTLTWTHPVRWRDLQDVDLRLRDRNGTALWVRFTEGMTSTFSLLDADGRVVGTGVGGSDRVLESDTSALHLAQSNFTNAGPDSPSVTVTFSVSFKPLAAGRIYAIELLASDDNGNIQGADVVGAWAVGPFSVDLPLVVR